MMRGTLHLVTARDYLRLRPALQPVLTKGMRSVLRNRASALDVDALVEEARAYFLEKPRTFGELRNHMMTLHPKGDERAMGFVVRMTLPLVLVPSTLEAKEDDANNARWGYPADADFAVAESWIGEALDEANDAPDHLVLRYLAAFGPATVGDAQTWSGLQALAPVFERLREKLAVFRDERGKELFDVPEAPRPSEDTAVPARFLPEFDNLIVSRTDARFVPIAHRSRVFSRGCGSERRFSSMGSLRGLGASRGRRRRRRLRWSRSKRSGKRRARSSRKRGRRWRGSSRRG